MTFQQFLAKIKGGTLPRLLEKPLQRHEDFPFFAAGVKGFSQPAIPTKHPTL